MTSERHVRPRVFVSSVVEGFQEFREAVRRGVETAGGDPVLVNEDFPSLLESPRNACLDAIDTVDYFVAIVGDRGGWTTPSGRLVVEEEYDHARSRRIPVAVFIQSVARDESSSRFAQKLSDYVDGHFRRAFTSPVDLEREVERTFRPLFQAPRRMSQVPVITDNYLASFGRGAQSPLLGFMLMPSRQEEVFSPVVLDSREFRHRILELAHAAAVHLLDYEHAKSADVRGSSLRIVQKQDQERYGAVEVVISESGELTITIDATSKGKHNSFGLRANHAVAVEDVEQAIGRCFLFAAALYDAFDPYRRHTGFRYNVALGGMELWSLERNPKPRTSYTMRMDGRNNFVAFEEPREIERSDLAAPGDEIARTIVLLKRQIGD